MYVPPCNLVFAARTAWYSICFYLLMRIFEPRTTPVVQGLKNHKLSLCNGGYMKALCALVLFTLFLGPGVAFACDNYRLKQVLEAGGEVVIDNSCSSYEARQLAKTGRERLTVVLAGFSAYDAKQIAAEGASLTSTASDYSTYDLRQIARIAKHRLSVDIVGFSTYDARLVVAEGLNFYSDKNFSTYDTRQICEELVSPARGYVYSEGFSAYDLRQITLAGCEIIYNGDPSELSYYEARRILEDGGSLEIRNQYSTYETRQLAEIGRNRLTVHLQNFSAYEAGQIASAGTNFYLDNTFSIYEVRQICTKRSALAVGKVHGSGFSDYELRQIQETGCVVLLP